MTTTVKRGPDCLCFEDALARARDGASVARANGNFYLRLFDDGLYVGLFATPDAPLKPLHFLRSASIVARDWYVLLGEADL